MIIVLLIFVLSVQRSSAVFSHPNPARESKHREFPWVASIVAVPNALMRGATIASGFYVLTGCKSITMASYKHLQVLAGSIALDPFENQGAQVRWIFYWEDHPKCRMEGEVTFKSYDISVIKVTQMFIFNDYLKPMPFERDQAKMKKIVDKWIATNKTCTLASFGGYRYDVIQVIVRPYIEELESTIYPPQEAYIPPDAHTSPVMREMSVTLVDYDTCQAPGYWLHGYITVQLNSPPVDAFCGVGTGTGRDPKNMTRDGMMCNNDYGFPIQCKIEDGERAGEYLVIGHASFGYYCRIRYADKPAVYARYDWALHDWITQFHNPDQYGDQWVEPEYAIQLEYNPGRAYTGPIPPGDIS